MWTVCVHTQSINSHVMRMFLTNGQRLYSRWLYALFLLNKSKYSRWLNDVQKRFEHEANRIREQDEANQRERDREVMKINTSQMDAVNANWTLSTLIFGKRNKNTS